MMARLIIRVVMGLVRPEMPPTFCCSPFRASAAAAKRLRSASSRPKARMTRTPVRFSRVMPVTPSSSACVFL